MPALVELIPLEFATVNRREEPQNSYWRLAVC
jgi:hypothetical protein